MNYNIHITAAAERDLIRAADHIEFVLKNPQAADDLLDEAEKQIDSLSDFPEKFRLVDDPVLASWGYSLCLCKRLSCLLYNFRRGKSDYSCPLPFPKKQLERHSSPRFFTGIENY
jgi:plasmid stabilization system protein ParE